MQIKEMLGKTFTKVYQRDNAGDELVFENDEESYVFYHCQDCCEEVYIESITGDLKDLEGVPLDRVEESSGEIEDAYESGTWTFYKFATIKGYVDVRWVGESNGYYSESVYFKVEKK